MALNFYSITQIVVLLLISILILHSLIQQMLYNEHKTDLRLTNTKSYKYSVIICYRLSNKELQSCTVPPSKPQDSSHRVSVYYTNVLKSTFCCDNVLHLYLLLTVSVYLIYLTIYQKYLHKSILLCQYSTFI